MRGRLTPHCHVVRRNLLMLDGIGDALFAVSLVRRLRRTYVGPAFRVRRASDSTTLDIGFLGDVVDLAALATFCAGTNGFLNIAYDQASVGRNLAQNTAANQPKIYDSVTGPNLGAGGRLTATFDSTNDQLTVNIAGGPSGTPAMAMAATCDGSATTGRAILSYGRANSARGDFKLVHVTNASTFSANTSGSQREFTGSSLAGNHWYLIQKALSQLPNAFSGYQDGVAVPESNVIAGTTAMNLAGNVAFWGCHATALDAATNWLNGKSNFAAFFTYELTQAQRDVLGQEMFRHI